MAFPLRLSNIDKDLLQLVAIVAFESTDIYMRT